MDPLKLLLRSTRSSKNHQAVPQKSTPSSGQNSTPQLFSEINRDDPNPPRSSKKRKRGVATDDFTGVDFFAGHTAPKSLGLPSTVPSSSSRSTNRTIESDVAKDVRSNSATAQELSLEERKALLKQHRLKVAWLNPHVAKQKDRRKSKTKDKPVNEKKEKVTLLPNPLESFQTLKYRYNIRGRIASNIDEEGYTIPTEVQIAALPLLLDRDGSDVLGGNAKLPVLDMSHGVDLLTVAPTGSGKTLAFLIPTIHHITAAKRTLPNEKRHISAIILAPTKELAEQIVNEGRKLANGTGIRISQGRKGMRLVPESATSVIDDEDQLADEEHAISESGTIVKSDILVSTPGTLDSIVQTALQHDQAPLSTVRYLVLDEADVLLDPLFREQTLTIWNALTNPELRVSLWSATMGSNIEEFARAQIEGWRTHLSARTGTPPIAAPLLRLVVGLKDSAVPNVHHHLTYAASEQGKLMSLRQILRPTHSSSSSIPSLVPPFLVFTQTIDRAIALHSELLYDIPPEAGGGVSRIAVLHADLGDAARAAIMARFRRAEIWVLITTDLLSRGVDFRGVNGVVNYDLPTSGAAYVHRVGRTGRAGRSGGVAITLYTVEDVPFLKNVANVIVAAQKQQGAEGRGAGAGAGAGGVQPWMLEALPKVSKRAKKELKARGVVARTARGRDIDPKAARRARISTKAGFVRREENRKKGAREGAQRRREEGEGLEAGEDEEGTSGSEFDGFG